MFIVLFALELIGGASTASNMVLLTDLFEDRQLYARAVGLAAMSEQFNQAIGLALGGGLIALLGYEMGLLFDLLSFVVAAVVILFVVELRPVTGGRGRGLRGFARDLSTAAGDLAGHPVLARLVTLSAVVGSLPGSRQIMSQRAIARKATSSTEPTARGRTALRRPWAGVLTQSA